MIRRSPVAATIGSFYLLIQLAACSAPAEEDVVGTWVGPSGAQLNLYADRTFTAESMPRDVFFESRQGDRSQAGEGTWYLEKATGYWQVRLSFRRTSDYPQGYFTSVLVAGAGDSTVLFAWVGEEGGKRFELTRALMNAGAHPL